MAGKDKKKTKAKKPYGPSTPQNPKESSSKPHPKRLSTAAAAGVVLLSIIATQIYGSGFNLRNAAAKLLPSLIKPRPRPSRAEGFFSAGCRWRDAVNDKKLAFWDIRDYEYWNETSKSWSSEQPAACRVQLDAPTPEYQWYNDSRTTVNCNANHCIIDNLWYNDGRFFLLSDQENGTVR